MRFFRDVSLMALLMCLMATVAFAGTAKLQVIHNAADPGAAVVDVYVNGDRLLDDFAFRAATPFVEVPAGVKLEIGVAPGNSMGPGDILKTFPVTLESNQTYVAIANGVLDPNAFAENPDGANIDFTIFARDRIRTRAWFRSFVKLIAFHGATDAPTVDIVARGRLWNPLFDDLSYGEFSHYRTLYAKEYILDVTPGNDNSTIVASFKADLRGLGGGAAVVFASGFLDPSMNQDGKPFGLFAALPDGTVAPLPAVTQPTMARLQVIHNAADPGAASVDVYVNDDLLLDNFAFRAATPFIDVPAGVDLNIGVAPPNSSSVDDVLKTITVKLEPGKTYVAVANGVLDPDGFAENPNGRSIDFTLFARDGALEKSPYGFFVKVMALHGATDAPAVDITARAGKYRLPVFRNLQYGDFSRYKGLLPVRLILDITPAGDRKTVVASFEADLRGLAGGAAIVFASGFLSPADNQDGMPFGLFAALPDGTVVPLKPVDNGYSIEADGPLAASSVPREFSLDQNYPNPFNPTTSISFNLPTASAVTLDVYNVRGQLVERIANESFPSGPNTVSFDASNLASGTYFYRIQAGTYTNMKKMVLLK